jgi:hypothetical protein
MKAKHLLLQAMFALLFFTGCQKDLNGTDQATEKKIHWKWQVESLVINENISGVSNTRTYAGKPEDYVDFRNDGKMYTFFNNVQDISDYEIKDEKTIFIDGDAAKIHILTETTFVFSSKDETGSIGYVEVVYNLKK